MTILLANYLSPSQVAHLSLTGDLPDETRATLAARLRNELTACAAYIPARLVHKQLSNPHPGHISGSFWHGSLLFADLSGFTYLCQHLSILGKQGAEEVSAVVNQLFNTLVAEVMAHQGETLSFRGELLKFGGDALTAFFDTETLGEHHATAATLAALAMQRQMEAFSSIQTRAGAFRLRLRIGVHSGSIFAAEVGDTSHMELVVTGTEVNRVATAQKIACPGEVVISEKTASLLQDSHLLPKEADGFYRILSLPERDLPTASCPLTSRSGNDIATLQQLAHQVEALRPYLVRNLPRRFLDSTASDVGEFRPVSVLFANFYDFSAMLSRFGTDANLAATALNAYFCRTQAVVHRHGGIINKVDMYTHGDKLMALFGAPLAHEDDPLLTVHCAFELNTALEEANAEIAMLPHEREVNGENHSQVIDTHAFLKQRIGISTGTVFAGRVGGTHRYEYTVMGPAVNLSARLMELAEEGMILLSPDTHQAVKQRVVVIEQPPVHIKGMAETIIPVSAIDEGQPPILSTRSLVARPPLIGRDKELDTLLQEATTALRENGRVLALVGEIGVGKTRLVEEMVLHMVMSSVSQNRVDAVPHFHIFTGEGQSLKQSVPYVTLRAPLSQVIGFDAQKNKEKDGEWRNETIYHSIQSRTERLAPEFSHFTPLLSDVLGIELPETPLTKSLSPEQRHRRIQELVVALFQGAASGEPAILVIDDLQWADTLSLKILTSLAHTITRVPLLLVLSYRSDTDIPEPWSALPATTRLELRELSKRDSIALLSALLETTPSPEMLLLLERTQGNPFFIEELVRTLVASESLARDEEGSWHLTCSPDRVTMPSSIEGLITARLDRLEEPYHELVQVASVIGLRFPYIVLEGVYPHPELLLKGLQRLRETDIIVIEEKQRELTYHFRHALLRDVAYERILYAKRRELHRQVAERIEELNTGSLDEHLALLARHYLLAEDWYPAFRYHLDAGIQAQNRYANQEALTLFATTLEIAAHLTQATGGRRKGTGDRRRGPEDRRKQDELEMIPPEGDRRMGPSDRRKGDQDRRHVLGDRRLPSGDTLLHADTSAEARERRQIEEDWQHRYVVNMSVVELHEHLGDIHTLMGNYDQAQKSYLEALALIEYLRIESQTWMTNSGAIARFHAHITSITLRVHRLLAHVLDYRERYEEAFDWLEQGMAMATPNDNDELARCYLLGASISQHLGHYEQSLDWAHQGLSLAESLGDTPSQAHALLLLGNLWRDRGELAQSIPALEQARALFDQMKDATRLSETLKNLGDTYRLVGRWKEAIACYQQSMQISETIGDVMGMARSSNNLALVLLDQGELGLSAELFLYSNDRFRQIGSLLGLAVTGCNHGKALLFQGKARDALHLIRASILSLERIKARNHLPEALRLAAEATLILGDMATAHHNASLSLEIARELGLVVDEALAHYILGKIALQQNDVATASNTMEHSQRMLEELENRHELGKVLLCLCQLKYVQGDTDSAYALLQRAKHIFTELGAKHDLKLANQHQKRWESSAEDEQDRTSVTC